MNNNNETEAKAYISLFVCRVTWAIHLKIVCDLSVEAS